jgi:hypothetical protein
MSWGHSLPRSWRQSWRSDLIFWRLIPLCFGSAAVKPEHGAGRASPQDRDLSPPMKSRLPVLMLVRVPRVTQASYREGALLSVWA